MHSATGIPGSARSGARGRAARGDAVQRNEWNGDSGRTGRWPLDTARAVRTAARPGPTTLGIAALGVAALLLGGCGHVCREAPGLTEAQCASARGLLLPEALPAPRGNLVTANETAVRLGFDIFFDARFSSDPDREVRCATCHQPERTFQDGLPTSQALGTGRRNSPSLLNAAWMRWLGWDGHADSLWSQPLFAFEHPLEMGFTRVEVARQVFRLYRAPYERVFGPMPPLDDASRFPARGAPGMAGWEAMAEQDRQAIQQVVANVGKALEGYMRRVAAGRSALDRHLLGEPDALTAEQVQGLTVFVSAGCTDCHGGPLLTDERFRNLGLPPLPGAPEDAGREEGLALLAANPFNALGPFHDGPRPADAAPPALTPGDRGAFRTPSLRNLARTAPYGHDGRWKTLEEAVDHHLDFLEPPPAVRPTDLEAAQRSALLAFLRALEGTPPQTPYNDWPDR